MDVVTDTICASEAFFAYVSSHGELAENLRAIRRCDRSANGGAVVGGRAVIGHIALPNLGECTHDTHARISCGEWLRSC
jgi:hypothetical protein